MHTQPQDNFLKALIVCGVILFAVFFMAALDVTTGLVSLLMPSGEFFIVFMVLLLAGSIWFAWRLNIPVVWYFYRDREPDTLPQAEQPAPAPTPIVTPTVTVVPTVGGRHRSYTFAGQTQTLRRKTVD